MTRGIFRYTLSEIVFNKVRIRHAFLVLHVNIYYTIVCFVVFFLLYENLHCTRTKLIAILQHKLRSGSSSCFYNPNLLFRDKDEQDLHCTTIETNEYIIVVMYLHTLVCTTIPYPLLSGMRLPFSVYT